MCPILAASRQSLDESDFFYKKENQTASSDSSSALLTGKILQFKKSLSMPADAQSLHQQDNSIVRTYSESVSMNALRSLDYITADSGLHGTGPRTGFETTGRSATGSSTVPLSTDSNSILVNKIRRIAQAPYKILDAPNLQDDFYLNLVDWSSANTLAVALAQHVYIWNANTSSVCELVDLGERNRVTSVAWSQKGNHLSVGTYDGKVQIWDV